MLDHLKSELMKEELKALFKEAYELGIQDSKKQYKYPLLLTKKDLAEIFQVKEATVNKIVGRRGFPKARFVSARYPRDEVFKWMEENSVRNSVT
ncbi:DNA-binding protein [Siminovitchia terrae]|uniref:DNA-binding protein n=3 Tax=Siminovitchia TaxID=2837510 RepID=A0A429X2J9_SIMTE|nr:DNA-binding protein [Siminovitchia terrae]